MRCWRVDDGEVEAGVAADVGDADDPGDAADGGRRDGATRLGAVVSIPTSMTTELSAPLRAGNGSERMLITV